MIWVRLHPKATEDMLGFIPDFLNEADPRPAREQLDSNYQHGGGWSAFQGFTLITDGPVPVGLEYPGDPMMRALAMVKLRDESVVLFEHAWVAIIQPDGSYEVSRMD